MHYVSWGVEGKGSHQFFWEYDSLGSVFKCLQLNARVKRGKTYSSLVFSSVIQRFFFSPAEGEQHLEMSVNSIWGKIGSLSLVSFMAIFKQEATWNAFHSSKVAAGVLSPSWLSSKMDWLRLGNSLLPRSTAVCCPYVCNLYINITATWSQQEFCLLSKFKQNYVSPQGYVVMHLY